MPESTLLQSVCEHVRETATLRSTMSLLEWDQHTKLPSQGNGYRTQQITFLSGLVHERATKPQLGEWLNQLAQDHSEDVDSETHATVRELKRQYDKLTKLPSKLVQALAESASTGQALWAEARKNNDFASLAPHFENQFRLKREQADALGYSEEPYDALLDEYEPGATGREIALVFDQLLTELQPLVQRILATDGPDDAFLYREFPVKSQESFGIDVSTAIGFDYQRGRLDVTQHPFCTEMGPEDCRICTRYNENFFSTALFGTLHEAGHGIYEQGLRSDQYGLPLGSYCSLGIHESQSRLWENLVGRSDSFWRFFLPQAKLLFGSLNDVDLDSFYKAINKVKASLIRVEADEITYNLHVIIRFKLERDLINGTLAVVDLADAWNEMYQEFLGLHPPNDADGVLQDVHWPIGLIGYFPTYTLGNLYASQLFEAAEAALGNLGEMFAKGEFLPLKEWLNQNVHRHGKRYSGPELCRVITGRDLDHDALMRHLNQKFGDIYGLG